METFSRTWWPRGSAPWAWEKTCIDTVEAGYMTKDLATLTGGASWLTTRQFLAKIKESLDKKLPAGG